MWICLCLVKHPRGAPGNNTNSYYQESYVFDNARWFFIFMMFLIEGIINRWTMVYKISTQLTIRHRTHLCISTLEQMNQLNYCFFCLNTEVVKQESNNKTKRSAISGKFNVRFLKNAWFSFDFWLSRWPSINQNVFVVSVFCVQLYSPQQFARSRELWE